MPGDVIPPAARESDEPDLDEMDLDDETGGNCHWCGGDGWIECDDPLQCTYPHDRYGCCPCSSCGGSGRARDMTIW